MRRRGVVQKGGLPHRTVNIVPRFIEAIAQEAGLSFNAENDFADLRVSFGPRDVLGYLYAVLWAPSYVEQYDELLRADFARVPLPPNGKLLRRLAQLGSELISLHIMESPKLNNKIFWSDDTVWLDKGETAGFAGVPEQVWNFYIGGYQICDKWLKDGKGRVLSNEDVEHYHRMVLAVSCWRLQRETAGLWSRLL